MSMLDSFFNKGFKAAKCKTLLKLTIPRIKLLRNRREIQIKQMRRDIAKLLETGQEATARIRIEHIVREEKMMAAQEIIELFCELITVRLPIIEAQRECPLDLKEAISSVCFAAPRCADLTELLQVQMLFASKYGKEFVSAATELMPECGVNRQLVELLSVRAPAPDVKLKLLKEIAEEHELDWDPAASESELLKPHEDLLNGPTQFVSGSTFPLPKEKHDESLHTTSEQAPNELSDSDTGFEPSDVPKVPNISIQRSAGTVSAPEMLPFPDSSLSDIDDESPKPSGGIENLSHEPHLEPEELVSKSPNNSVGEMEDKQSAGTVSGPEMLPFSASSLSDIDDDLPKPSGGNENLSHEPHLEPKELVSRECESPNNSVGEMEDKQFLPFISPPSLSSAPFTVRQDNPPPSLSRTITEANVDLQDVLAAAQAAAECAERAAASARAAATLAQVRISDLVKRKNDVACDDGIGENPFHKNPLGDSDGVSNSPSPREDHRNHMGQQVSNLPSYDDPSVEPDFSLSNNHVLGPDTARHQPQRLPSIDDEPDFSYPSLFTSHDSNPVSRAHSFADNSGSPKAR